MTEQEAIAIYENVELIDTIQWKKAHLALLLIAKRAMLEGGQQYSIGSLQLSNVHFGEIERQIKAYQLELKRLTNDPTTQPIYLL